MRRIAALALVTVMTVTGVHGAGVDVAQGLADVIAAEEFCGLTYDQAAIEAFIADNVEADDLEFTGLLRGLLFVAQADQETMSASAAAAHCAQVRRLAQHYRFIAR